MNSRPLRPCNKPGCPNLTQEGYCEQHKTTKTENNRYYDKYLRNKKHDKFYKSKAWTKCRDIIRMRDDYTCQECLRNGELVLGKIVDHIIPLEVDWSKRLDEDNLQFLCQSCHNKKTKEDLRKYGKK